MLPTGIVRKIDNLGRIVVPKEMRQLLQIKNNDSIEMLVQDGTIVIRKFSTLNGIREVAQSMIDAYNSIIKQNMMVTDRDQIIAANSTIKEQYLNQKITPELFEVIKTNMPIMSQKTKITEADEQYIYAFPIISQSNTIGLIIIMNDELITEYDVKIINIIAKFLGDQLED